MSPQAEPEFRWTQDDWGDSAAPAEPSTAQQFLERHGWLVRGTVLVMALLLFKLTASAFWATVLSCLELGRTDLGIAHWLWRTDPDRRRGGLNALCHLAGAAGRVGLTVLIALGPLIYAASLIRFVGVAFRPVQQIMAAVVVTSGTFGLGSVLSFGVCVAALISGRKLWLGPELRLAYRQRVWPPSAVFVARPVSNRARVVVCLACLFVLVPILITLGATLPRRVTQFGPVLIIPIAFLLTLLCRAKGEAMAQRILARSPDECWPLVEPAALDFVPDHP